MDNVGSSYYGLQWLMFQWLKKFILNTLYGDKLNRQKVAFLLNIVNNLFWVKLCGNKLIQGSSYKEILFQVMKLISILSGIINVLFKTFLLRSGLSTFKVDKLVGLMPCIILVHKLSEVASCALIKLYKPFDPNVIDTIFLFRDFIRIKMSRLLSACLKRTFPSSAIGDDCFM